MRHDIPKSDWAWGLGFEKYHANPYFRLYEVGLDYEGPIYTYGFIENKDVFGLTVRATVANVLNARSKRNRTVWTGLRGESPIAFVEKRDRLIGPIFAFSVRGKF